MFLAFQKITQALRGVSVAVSSFFNLVTLLLNTTSTNGAQNNTFLDTSSIGNTVTRNGTPTQGTFTPFSQASGYWSVFNSGSSSYCQLNNSNYSISTGDFTIEFWMFITSDKSTTAFATAASNPNLTVAMTGGSAGARQPYLEYAGAGTSFTALSNYLNTWTHVAFVRNSGTVTVYQNGVALSSASKSGAVGDTANLYLLRNSGDANQDLPGYISNFRICKSAVYTSTFTPSTIPLTTTSQGATSCQLLTFQDNRFKDNSSNASTVTPTSTAVQAFSPFLPTAAYDAAVVGGSGYFDGSGDYLTLAPGSAFAFGTSDFTVETWFYPTSAPADDYIIDARNSGQTNTWTLNFAYGGTSGQLNWGYNGSILVAATTNDTVKPYIWSHIAYTRTGTTGSLYVNGVRVGTGTDSSNYSVSPTTSYVGCRYSVQNFADGYFSGMRVVNGTALYTGTSYTIPTAPPTAITNTSLLLNYTNSGIYDSAAKNDLETVGNAQVSTTQAKWGTTSIYFDGSGDYLYTPNPCLPNSGNFTLEMWIYPTSTAGYQLIYSQYTSGSSGGNFELLWDEFNEKFNVNFRGSTILTSSSTYSLNAWHHLAIVRSGSTFTMYVDGSSAATATNSDTILQTASYVGTRSLFDSFFNGYIDDLRITRGYAVYSGATYTVPTAAFPTL